MVDDALRIDERVEEELERRLFHLKTLYDVSRELLVSVDVEQILRNFLMMTTGNFGVLDGFVFIQELPSRDISHFVSVGFKKNHRRELEKQSREVLFQAQEAGIGDGFIPLRSGKLPTGIVCAIPLRVDDSCSGLLGLGPKLVGEPYSDEDKDLLITLANNLTVVLKNARYAEALEDAYNEVSSLNRAKDKVLNHLSHELKTPLSLLKASIQMLRRKLTQYPESDWKKSLDRAERNLQRLMDVQYEVQDIMQDKEFKAYEMLKLLLDQCAEQLQVLATEEVGEGEVVERIRNRIEEIYGCPECEAEAVDMAEFVGQKLAELKPSFEHRLVDVSLTAEKTPIIFVPKEPLDKVVSGLVRNAIENTPDEGRVSIIVSNSGEGVRLKVQDTGVGIIEDHQRRIFEGFYPTQETDAYSSKKPFDFNAGGKGADLLRMKIFSERYNFDLSMASTRCKVIPGAGDVCPGSIRRCLSCDTEEDCYQSGGTSFEVYFPIGGKETSVHSIPVTN
jgi:K+-sensing histidine kinase KdpD